MYRLINECENVTIRMTQVDKSVPLAPEDLDVVPQKSSMICGLYEPEGERQVQLDIIIDRNVRGTFYRRGMEGVRIQVVDLNDTVSKKRETIEYQDVNGLTHSLELSLRNDG